MSVDLSIQSSNQISDEKLKQVCDEITLDFPDVTFIKDTCRFFSEDKCFINYSEESHEIIVSSNAAFYDFVEFVAFNLAKKITFTNF